MARKVIDWTALKTEYAAGNESLTKFSARVGLAMSAVKKHAAAEEWDHARETFRADVARRTAEERAKFRARSEADIDNRAHLIADDLTVVIQARLRKAKERALAKGQPKGKKGEASEEDTESALDLKLMSDGLQKAYEIQRVTAGLPRQKVPERVQLDVGVEVTTGVVELPALVDE